MSRRVRNLLCILILPCVLLLFGAVAAHAQDDDDEEWEEEGMYSTPGTYFAMGISITEEDFAGTIGDDGDNDKLRNVRGVDSPGYGGGFRLGTRAIEWVSYELQFETVSGMDFKSDPFKKREPEIYSTTLNTKIFALHGVLDDVLKGRIQPYLLGGFGMMIATDTGIGTPVSIMGRFGGGVDVHINESWAMYGEGTYAMPGGNLEGMRYSSFGLGFIYQLE